MNIKINAIKKQIKVFISVTFKFQFSGTNIRAKKIIKIKTRSPINRSQNILEVDLDKDKPLFDKAKIFTASPPIDEGSI